MTVRKFNHSNIGIVNTVQKKFVYMQKKSGKKLWSRMSFSSTCFCYYRKHPNNDKKICPLPSSCFQQHFYDCSMYLCTIQICRNLNEYNYYLIPTTFVIWQIVLHSSRWICFPISNFSKYYFKTGTTCLLFSFSHVFTALGLDSNHFGTLLWKIIKPRGHNEIKPT